MYTENYDVTTEKIVQQLPERPLLEEEPWQ
jgi:hypothetical protein